ncbi:MAG: sigma-70 family RNA polymerase sigma factor [Gammaproteobacteria bacterium]
MAERRRFNRLIGDLRQELYSYSLWLCRDPHLADDVLQEALLRAWRGFAGLDDDNRARQWMVTIVRREFLRAREKRRDEATDPLDLQQLADPGEDPMVTELRQAIFRLDDNYREPLMLQVLMGYSAEEIGQVMDMKPGAVLTRLHRAREKLKTMFVEGDEAAAEQD